MRQEVSQAMCAVILLLLELVGRTLKGQREWLEE